ncbi:SDR family oxidoreductase [Ottowia sp. GY511]|uniref:SDR family oxidoreductase n=1 Tax=Ottowia flava TaxID=2675430 RepID=A0ABW4KVI7_9BURK|nr:SDR family oxidoreductase [Ottowia sp. GY511]TXK33121.1 SDR family oxidoreductase [Ottowia sp. GY511]
MRSGQPPPPLAFITGASSGIGQALALRYRQAGWRVALIARRKEAMQAWTLAQGWSPDCFRIYAADVSAPDEVIAAAQACLAEQGLPDVVIANAGISIGMDTAEHSDLDVMSRTLATNNIGMAATFHPFVAPMRQRGSGRLVGIASVAAVRGLPGHGAYCASKAGVVSYCESLRGELRGSGVKVLTIAPGFIDTPLTRGNRYPMPFLMSAPAFANQAFRAIQAGRSYCVIPWQMGVVAKLMRALPNAMFDRLMHGRGRKAREGEV